MVLPLLGVGLIALLVASGKRKGVMLKPGETYYTRVRLDPPPGWDQIDHYGAALHASYPAFDVTEVFVVGDEELEFTFTWKGEPQLSEVGKPLFSIAGTRYVALWLPKRVK